MKKYWLFCTVVFAACQHNSVDYSTGALPQLGLQRSCEEDHGTGVQYRYLGASTILFDDKTTKILIDGFFSRPRILRLLLPISPNRKRISDALNKAEIDELAVVATAHSHYDHAMDTSIVANMTGAEILGSESSVNIASGQGFPRHLAKVINLNQEYEYGAFRIRAIVAPHGPQSSLLDKLLRGRIKKPLKSPAFLFEYKIGASFSYIIGHHETRIIVHPSPGFVRDQYAGYTADIVFLGVGKLGKQDRKYLESLWGEVVRNTQAKTVILVHWDSIFRPLTKPLRHLPWPLDDFDNTVSVLSELARFDGVSLQIPRAFQPMNLGCH